MFNTPVVTPFFYGLSRLWLHVAGWKVKGAPPREPKFVVIACPHTSNWDVPITIAICIDKDMALIQAEYAGIKGKYPDQSRW
ncbi:MAG: hypothetical protein IIB69_07465 [Proteobacteria bacterium]|nr:hypothetical protein [Pseudomonadota bacterium]